MSSQATALPFERLLAFCESICEIREPTLDCRACMCARRLTRAPSNLQTVGACVTWNARSETALRRLLAQLGFL